VAGRVERLRAGFTCEPNDGFHRVEQILDRAQPAAARAELVAGKIQ